MASRRTASARDVREVATGKASARDRREASYGRTMRRKRSKRAGKR